jgi:hypothetical protein
MRNGIEPDAVASSAAAASSKALTATLGGGGVLFFGGWTANDLAMLIGAVVAVLGLLLQWYYRHREFRMRQREHGARMAAHTAMPSDLKHEADE